MSTSSVGFSLFPWLLGLVAFGISSVRADPMPVSRASEAARNSLTVAMRVDVSAANGLTQRQIRPGDTARTGERIHATAWLDQPGYLYIVGYSHRGWSELIFPSGPPVRVNPGARIRVPEPGTWFTLAGEPGDVTLVALASREPLDEASARELRVQWPLPRNEEGTRGGGEKQTAKKDPPPPPPSTPDRAEKRDAEGGTRGGAQRLDEQSRTVTSQTGESGRAWIWFTFRHEQ